MEGVSRVRFIIISQLNSQLAGGLYLLIGGSHPRGKWVKMEGGQNASTAYLMRKVPHVRISGCRFAHYRLRGVISAGRSECSSAELTIDRQAGDSTPLRTCRHPLQLNASAL